MHKHLPTLKVPKMEWLVIASTYLETNVTQRWDMLAMKLHMDKKDPSLWEKNS